MIIASNLSTFQLKLNQFKNTKWITELEDKNTAKVMLVHGYHKNKEFEENQDWGHWFGG